MYGLTTKLGIMFKLWQGRQVYNDGADAQPNKHSEILLSK